MSSNSIGKYAIKIAFIQTAPGYESEVKSELKKACQNSDLIKDYAFFKGLGNFDIIHIYATNDFSSSIREAGPIKHILKSNVLLCYPYLSKSIKTIFAQLKDNLYSTFCMLKISPGLKKKFSDIDSQIRKYMGTQDDLLLGSLGWNELIVIKSSNHIDDIYKHNLEIGSITLETPEDDSYSVILKTLSYIGINYKYIPSQEIIWKGLKTTENYLIKRQPKLKSFIDNKKIEPTIEITTKSIYVYEIKKYFEERGFAFFHKVGKHDIVIRFNSKKIRWSYFLAIILHFRAKYRAKIFSTSTNVVFKEIGNLPLKTKDIHLPIKLFKFIYSELEATFGHKMASNLSNLFYSLNSSFQNPLSGNTFADMIKYPEYVCKTGTRIKSIADKDKFALASTFVIGRGLELRSYGTYDSIEEVSGRYSEFRGGCQISLLALELLPSVILSGIGFDWKGFITASGEPKFNHINQVVNVTSEALWNPHDWWALYHEIAHIIIEEKDNIIGKNVPAVDLFLSIRNDFTAYYDLIELSAEVIGFEIGFFGNYDLYFNLLWEYLLRLQTVHDIPIETYAIRTFFIELFVGRFGSRRGIKETSRSDFYNLELLYERFISHMVKIENKFRRNDLFKDKQFIAAGSVKMLRDIYPVCSHLSHELLKLKLRPDNLHLRSSNTRSTVSHIEMGRIWWEKIDCPQAVLYNLIQKDKIEFNTCIATILSFWNQQTHRLDQA